MMTTRFAPHWFAGVILLSAAQTWMPTLAHAEDLRAIMQQAQEGQPAAALDRINNYLATNPKDVQAVFMRGVLLAETGKKDEAIKVFTMMTQKYPTLPEPYNNLAVLYAEQGQYDKARKSLESAISTHPSYSTAHENLGDLYAQMAADAYGKALQLDNANARAKSKMALIRDLMASPRKPVVTASAGPTLADAGAATNRPLNITPAQPTRPADKLPEIKPADPKAADVKVDNKPIDSKPIEAKPVETNTAEVKPAAELNPADQDKKDVEAALREWAKAWSSKNVDRYLDTYASSFNPDDGISNAQWREQRRQRINAPSRINVSVSNVRVSMEGADTAQVRFHQTYRADSGPMGTSKRMQLKKVGGRWLITSEVAGR